MAGDWIKMQTCLPDKPEVWQIASIVRIDPDAVIGKLLRVWAWFDTHTEDGNAVGVTFSLVDRIAGVTGFAEAMSLCGWLEQRDINLTLPKFSRHNGSSAKTRALTNDRVAKTRNNKGKSNAECNADTVTKTVTREEKRREETTTPSEPSGFAEFWSAYPKKIGKGAAETAFKKAKINGHLPNVLKAIDAQKKTANWQKEGGQFIPNPATWLNQRRWEDECSFGGDWAQDLAAGAV